MINEIRIKIADFLNIMLIDTKFLYINIWSFIHFFTGFVFGYWLKFITPPVFITLVILYEIAEIILSYTTPYFILEPGVDILWDLIITLGAYFLARSLVN